MFDLGFTMEELMFPENYQSNCLFKIEIDCSIDEIALLDDNQEQIVINYDDDDDWFTIKQLNPVDIPLNGTNFGLMNDQTLPLLNNISENFNLDQMKSTVQFEGSIAAMFSSNSSIKIGREKDMNSSSSSSVDTIPHPASFTTYNQSSSNVFPLITEQQTKYRMSKSTSSLSFSTQSSTSVTSISADEMSPKSSGRRRRLQLILKHLKEAFIENPKPSQQDIAILSEQLGHDSYVIRVWFYNKRQATKKRNV
ncbi:hypothetical protein I4U23_009984 [Adineta vaga]|nr:hypothetical protein I4U23_009984 [Adineta vaga]